MPVNITIACIHCGKEYSIPDSVVGKRVKCQKCGEVFVATRPADSDLTVDFAALETLEPADYAPPPIGTQSSRGRAAVAPSFSGGNSVDSGPLQYAPPIQRTRRGRAAGPLDDLIHDKLPLLLILVGIVIPLVIAFVALIRTQPEWRAVFVFILGVCGYVSIVIPCTVVGLRIAAHAMNFELVDSPGYRVVAAFAASWIVLVIYAIFFPITTAITHGPIETRIAGIILWLLTGLLVSVLASFGFLKLFFGLRIGEAIVTWLIASVSYIIGNIASAMLVILILWLLNNIIASTQPRSSSESAASGNSSSVNANSPIVIDTSNPRGKTASNLRQMYFAWTMFHDDHKPLSYPTDLESLCTAARLTTDVLKSPFGPSGGLDYIYTQFPVPSEDAGHDFIVIYDAAEGPVEQGMTVVRGDGTIEFLPLDDFAKALAASKSYTTTEYQKYTADLVARQTPPPTPTPAPAPQPSPTPDATKPIEPIEPIEPSPPQLADPVLPAHAWTAQPDPPIAQPHISPHLRHVFSAGGVFYFPPQPSDFVLISRHDPTNKLPDKYPDELWNLKTLTKVSEFNNIPVSTGGVLSADGKRFAIRSLSGPDLATAYQIYSTHGGKLEHTLNGPPLVGKSIPTPIGFVGDDQLVTLGDDFDVWDIDKETGLRHFGDRTKIDAKTLVAISATGKLLAVLYDGETLSLYSTESGKLLGQTPIPDFGERKSEPADALRALRFSPDGRDLALFLNGKHIYMWSIADGTLAARFALKDPIESAAKADGAVDSMVWTPDCQGWLVGGTDIIDRVTGVGIYKTAAFAEQGAKEIGQRRITDNGHMLLEFQSAVGDRIALDTFGIDAAVIEKNRTSMRALVAPATQE